MNLRHKLWASYIGIVVTCLVLGLIPLENWLTQLAGQDLGPWSNVALAQGAFLLAALALAIQGVVVSSMNIDSTNKLLFHLLVSVLIVNCSFLLVQFWKHLTSIVPDTWSEEVIYLSMVQSRRVSGMYSMSNLEQPPFLVSIYPPVWYAVVKTAFGLFGQSILVGKYVSIGAMLTAAMLLSLMGREGVDKTYSLAAPLLFLGVTPILAWGGTLAHPEYLAASLSLGGLVVYVKRGLGQGSKLWILWVSLLCAIALLTKPSAVAAPAAIGIHLLCQKRYRECIWLTGLTALWFFGTYTVLWWPTEGGIWLMTIVGNAVKLTPLQILSFGIDRLTSGFVLTALTAAAVLLFCSRARKHADAVVSLYFLVALSWFLVSVMKPGSGSHYFVQTAIGGSLAIGLLISKYAAEGNWTSFRLLVLLVAVGMTLNLAPQFGWAARSFQQAGDRTKIVNALARLKTQSGEYILADPPYSLAVVKAGHLPIINDSHPYTLMVENGVVSSEPLMDQLRDERVPYAILVAAPGVHASMSYGTRLWPVEVYEYLTQHYVCTVIERGRGTQGLVFCARQELAEEVDRLSELWSGSDSLEPGE